jgi:hypothetical protein
MLYSISRSFVYSDGERSCFAFSDTLACPCVSSQTRENVYFKHPLYN